MKLFKNQIAATLAAALIVSLSAPQSVMACTRVVHTSLDGSKVVTGRNMDWFEDIETNLWAFPAGMARDGAVGENAAQWTSKYGSVISAAFDVGTADGLNESGLMVNLLYLGEADFGERDITRQGISWSVYTQYLLDNFASVAEAVESAENSTIQLVASPLPGSSNHAPTLHFSLSDATGDSAIFEHLDGKLVIHHGKEYNVMTNSPTYDEQLALDAYWQTVGGEAMLPGTRRAADRFVRASYYTKTLPDPQSDRQAMANVMSVMRNAAVPFGESDPSTPNIATTIWSTAADNINKVYYFTSTLSPNIVWVNLNDIDLSEGARAQKIDMVGNFNLSGNVSAEFLPAEPFEFTGPEN